MTVTDIKGQIALQTQRKIEQMKQRKIIVPDRLVDRCALCDQLSQEIYDFATATLVKIVDRYHLHLNMDALSNTLHQDFCKLSNGAIEVLIARQALQGHASDARTSSTGDENSRMSVNQQQLIGTESERADLMSSLLLLWNRIKLRWGTRSAFHF